MKLCRRDAHELAGLYIGIAKQSKTRQSKAKQIPVKPESEVVFSAVSARGLVGMRAFFLSSRGDVNAPARSVEQLAASHVPSSFEQPADSFTSINALTA